MLVAQTGDLRPKADSSPSSALGAAATKPDSYHSSALGAAATKPDSSPSYGGHTKEIRAASRLEWLRAAVGEEADSFAFTARVRPASPAERQARSQIRLLRMAAMAATRRRFVLLHDRSGSGRRWARKQILRLHRTSAASFASRAARHEARFVSFVWWPHEAKSCSFGCSRSLVVKRLHGHSVKRHRMTGKALQLPSLVEPGARATI